MNSAEIVIDGDDSWTLRQAEVVESVSALGFMRIEVLNDDANLDPKDLLYQSVTIRVPTSEESAPWRQVKGIVWEARSLGMFRRGDDRASYQLVVVPPLMQLSLRRLDRSFNGFQGFSATDVWRRILDEWVDKVPYADEGPLMVLDNEPCTVRLQSPHQTMESDLDFLQRLFAAHGVFWYQDSDGDAPLPTLTLGTFSAAARAWGPGTPLEFNPTETAASFGPYVLQFTREAYAGARIPIVMGMHPALHATVGPTNERFVQGNPSDASFRGFEWFREETLTPYLGLELEDMQSRCAKVLEQAMQLDDVWGMGTATVTTMAPGRSVSIGSLPGNAPSEWFVTATRMLVAGPGIAAVEDVETPQFLTGFRAVPLDQPFRPPLYRQRCDPPPLEGGFVGAGFQHVARLGSPNPLIQMD